MLGSENRSHSGRLHGIDTIILRAKRMNTLSLSLYILSHEDGIMENWPKVTKHRSGEAAGEACG